MKSFFRSSLEEHLIVFQKLDKLSPVVKEAALAIANSLRSGNKLMLCGNGGSAADSQHMAAELTGRFMNDRKPLAAIALSTDSSALTCIANVYSFDDIFCRQVRGLGRKGDCLLAISTSGNSTNVIRAVEAAKSMGVFTIGLLGCDGGHLESLCNLNIIVDSFSTARIQEAHIFLEHFICAMIEIDMELT